MLRGPSRKKQMRQAEHARVSTLFRSSPDFAMQQRRALIVGGYGFFGSRLVERLALWPDLHVIVAGRDLASADALVRKLQPVSAARLESAAFDVMAERFASTIAELLPDVVIHASGPFQGHDYRVADACIRTGVHYIDLADGREFVTGISRLNAAAIHAGVFVISGASSVPALSSAAADRLAVGMNEVHAIEIGISPGNRTERGLSTIESVLSYCGKPVPDAGEDRAIGWGHAYRHRYPPPVGSRLLSPCDVPDLSLLPGRYPGTPAVRFGAGLELEFLHRGMNVMAGLARVGLVRDWSAHARVLRRVADLFKGFGSDAGAMHVEVSGREASGKVVVRNWQLLATDGDGPYVPTLAAAALLRKLVRGGLTSTGAQPCIGLLSLEEFALEASGLHITTEAW